MSSHSNTVYIHTRFVIYLFIYGMPKYTETLCRSAIKENQYNEKIFAKLPKFMYMYYDICILRSGMYNIRAQ